MTKSKPSDVLTRMKAAASREKPISTSVSEEADEQKVVVSAVPPRVRRVRFTLDLEPEMHKNLKRFALEADADASEVMRALLGLMHSDTAISNAVLTAIRKE